MWYISHSRKEGGALFQRWHQSNTVSESIPRVCFGKTERKSNELISCFEDGPVGSRITVWGDWTKHLPQQLGISAALDDAVALVMATHSAIIHKKCYTTWVDPRLYAKALGSLRHALADPSVYSSVHTLAAITALYYLEVG